MNYFLIFALLCLLKVSLQQESAEWKNYAGACVDNNGKPVFCYPPFTSAAAGRLVNASNTCGITRRQKFCIHMSNAAMSSRCQYCDARVPSESYDPSFLTDRNQNNWWQSETMDENPDLHFRKPVELTINLGTKFYVNYVYLQFKSPRPHAMVIYKKADDEAPWTPWAYFSSNCLTYFNMSYEPMPVFARPDEVICREEYSTLQPLYDGEVIFSVINGRPGTDDFFHNPALQEWSTASQIKVELQKMHTFGDESNAERDTLLTYYFAIRKFTVGGRCICHGHGNDCRPVGGYSPNPRLICVCDPSHHTAGDNCERCAPGYRDAPWKAAVPENSNVCKACECNGNSDHCEFDEEEYLATGSGGICTNCGGNTMGKHCETCIPGHYPDPDRPSICRFCGCDPMGALEGAENECSTDGQCKCKPGVGGKHCDRCLPDHHSFTSRGCQPCNCSVSGSLNNQPQCDPYTGQCICKANVNGKTCDRCKPGTFGMMDNDPLGCKQCFCSGHSSECTLAQESNGQIVPMEEFGLKALEETGKVIFSCPNGTTQCSVCFKQDKKTLDFECGQNYKGELECLCRESPNDCPFCVSGVWLDPQKEIRKEICQCPPGYTGPSCEQCIPGYRREPIGVSTTAICIPCTCNNNSDICDPETGRCECQYNTGGLFCDRCADGYYGNALAPPGSKDACQPCPCPHGAKCVETLLPLDKRPVVCVDCPNNRTGDRCERCAENFFGDPLNGIPCQPCDCSNNTDLRAVGNCDLKTGICQKCLFGTAGDHCEKCISGYRRNLKKNEKGTPTNGKGESETTYARGCQPCYCDPRGTFAMPGAEGGLGVCDEETGQCPCKSGVTGLRCDRCHNGFYGFDSGKGCTDCGCSPRGSKSETCDPRTGNCNCLAFTTGRTCDECLPGYFNLTTGVGCQDCGCHPFGSASLQCNTNGQCSCRSFATGQKCDQCEENRHDLSAGCLPCPPCYNLIQRLVLELRKKLENVFGSGPDPDGPGSTPQLYEQINRLNKTVQEAYNAALQNSLVSSAITNAEQLGGAINDLLKRASDISKELAEYTTHKPACMRPDLPQRLDSLKVELGKLADRIKMEGQRELDSFIAKVNASDNRDSTLTEQARNATDIVKTLKAEASDLRKTVQDIDTSLRTVEFEVDKSAGNMKDAFGRLNSQLTRLKEIMKLQRSSLKAKLDHVSSLTLQQRQRLTKLSDTLQKVPDVSAEQSRLEEILGQWTEALNKSQDLQAMLTTETSAIDSLLEELQKGRQRLTTALARQKPVVAEKARILERLEQLLNKSETAVQNAQRAVETANQQLVYLTDFDTYIVETKQELEGMNALKTQINDDLNKTNKQILGIHVQVDEALNASRFLETTVIFYDGQVRNLKDDVIRQIEETEALSKNQDEEDELYSQVRYEFKSSSDVLEGVRQPAEAVIELGKKSSNDVSQLRKDIDALFNKMKELKDKITNTSPDNGQEGDSAARFKEIKEEAGKMAISERIEYLRKMTQARVAELEYIRDYELKEFAANSKHLTRLLGLLPMLNHQRCFYSGKNIEGSRRRRKRSHANSTGTIFDIAPLHLDSSLVSSN